MLTGVVARHAFHLADSESVPVENGARCVAWCGALALAAHDRPLRAWGVTGPARERYCPQCEAAAHRLNIVLGSPEVAMA